MTPGMSRTGHEDISIEQEKILDVYRILDEILHEIEHGRSIYGGSGSSLQTLHIEDPVPETVEPSLWTLHHDTTICKEIMTRNVAATPLAQASQTVFVCDNDKPDLMPKPCRMDSAVHFAQQRCEILVSDVCAVSKAHPIKCLTTTAIECMTTIIHQQAQAFLESLLDHVIATEIVDNNGRIEIFGDLAAPDGQVSTLRLPDLNEDEKESPEALQQLGGLLTCMPSNARACWRDKLNSLFVHHTQWSPARGLKSHFPSWHLSGAVHLNVRNPILKLAQPTVLHGVIHLPISTTLDNANESWEQTKVVPLGKSIYVRRQRHKHAGAMVKLRSPYKRPALRLKSPDRFFTSSSDHPDLCPEESSEKSYVLSANTSATRLLRRPFQKHILVPKLSDTISSMPDSLTVPDNHARSDHKTDVACRPVAETPAVLVTPRVRRPFRKLTLVATTPKVFSSSQSLPCTSSETLCHDRQMQAASREHGATYNIKNDKKRDMVTTNLHCPIGEGIASVRMGTSPQSDSASQGDQCSSPRLLCSATIQSKKRKIFRPPVLSADVDQALNLRSTVRQLGLSNHSQAHARFHAEDSRASRQREICASPVTKGCTVDSAQDENKASYGWETASGQPLHIEHDPVLAAEWNSTNDSISKELVLLERRDGAATNELNICKRQTGLRKPVKLCSGESSHSQLALLQKQTMSLRGDLKMAESALKCQKTNELTELSSKIKKWRAIAQDCCDEYFVHVSRRVNEAGGVQAWHNSRKPQQWFETDEAENIARLKEEESQYDMTAEEKSAMNVGDEYFTMNLMLRDVGIPLALIRWNSELEQWS